MKNFATYDWKWKLQLFADGEGDDGSNGGDNDNDGADGNNSNGKVFTQEQVDALLKKRDEDFDKKFNQKFAEMQKKHQSELDEAEKLAKMSAEDKAKKEVADLKKEMEALKTANAKAEMMKTARSILADKKVAIADDLLETLVTTEAESTKKNVEQFAEAFTEAVQTEVKKVLAGKTPDGADKGKNGTKITKEEIMKISDYKERQKMMEEHIDLFR